MKMFLALMLVSSASFSQVPITCEIKLRPVGIYYNTCPINTLAEGVDVRIGNGPYPMVTTLVRCVKPIIECNQAQ